MKLKMLCVAFAAMVVVGVGASQGKEPVAVARLDQPIHIIDDTDNSSMEAVCGPGEERRYSDLCAQWKAADAASKAVDAAERANETSASATRAAWLTVAFSAIGAIGLIVSLALARDSARSASEASRSAGALLKAERAWMTPEGIEGAVALKWVQEGKDVGPYLGFEIIWRNSGRSPALHARYGCEHAFRNKTELLPNFRNPEYRTNRQTIGPGQSSSTAEADIIGDDVQKWLAGNLRLYVYCIVDYFDIYDANERRSSETVWAVNAFKNADGSYTIKGVPAGPQHTAT